VRLTHIKLAGFKSFVDPTHVPLPGQLVGVVGPNGCGKSNVIDAVRWVLGESSAKHLRGETMQDVIFNGSGDRKPANRASVELVFDNSLGKAAGAWSQYGEIAIKRVLERRGDSSYFINNIPVRRRDVSDLFLGTGLGARAYAIIEQGMISRIVDAKPEEVRVFLEEAAGVSKYRERRKETEARLEDSRENLLRVEDVRRELGAQIGRLEEQAVTAERYRTLEADIRRHQWLLWSVRQRDAGLRRTKLAEEVGSMTLDLERTTASLREAESQLESLRETHYAAGDAVHAAQGELYEANAQLARAEQQLQFLRQSRQRADTRRRELEEQIGRETERRAAAADALAEAESQRELAAAETEQQEARAETAREALPRAEQAWRDARADVEKARQAVAEAQRARDIAITRRDQAERLIAQLQARRDRLTGERTGLVLPDEAGIEALRMEREALEEEIAGNRERQAVLSEAIPKAEEDLREWSRALDSSRQTLAALEARRHALVGLQQQVGSSEQMAAWLGQHGLSDKARFWEKLHVRPGWEGAIEAVLRERLNAVAMDDPGRLADWFGASPPGKLAVYQPANASAADALPVPEGCEPLAAFVTCDDPLISAVLGEWLGGVYAVETTVVARTKAAELPVGTAVVCREGHIFTAHSVAFHAPDSEIHGLLERKQEIERLEADIPGVEAELAAQRARVAETDAALRQHRQELESLRNRTATLSQRRHLVELEEVRLNQALERARHRIDQIEREIVEIAEEEALEQEARAESTMGAEVADDTLARVDEESTSAQGRHREAESNLARMRELSGLAERGVQEARFAERSLDARIDELRRSLQLLGEQIAAARGGLDAAEAEAASLEEGPIAEELAIVLATKNERELVLGQRRDALAEAERAMRGADEARATHERRLEPLRERIGQLRLEEQEARIAEEGFAAQLAEANADMASIAEALEKPPRPNVLQGDINRLQEELASLGPVNLAALDELAKSTERKAFLDAQWTDLTEAVNTLEDAIRRIDREMRERLQATFDEVNGNLQQMFPQLFGGGEAKLVMTGDEILDSGVQIIARPPGKKNASIQLLSGGEKALTAVSLVFALFKLNPAPFCLLDEVDAPLDDSNTSRFCELVKRMSEHTQFIFISHNKITMEMAEQLVGVTMRELGVSRVVAVDVDEAMRLQDERAA